HGAPLFLHTDTHWTLNSTINCDIANNKTDKYEGAGGMRCKVPARRMAIPRKRPATPQCARQYNQNFRLLFPDS
ncbi:MAG: hypothetical protein RQ714_06610, partial [Nitrosomonas sp.]|nr:hypothetical protein [Nitrosomonas sp.]